MSDPIEAVLITPQLARFREITGLGEAPLVADFTGWNKHVLLAPDRVFLFPRHQANVEWLERELTAYEAVAPAGLSVVPRLLGRWHDEAVSPYPFAAVTRLRGSHPDDAAGLFADLGRLVAQWHRLDPPSLPGARPPAHHAEPHQQWLRRALDPAQSAGAATEAAVKLGRADDAAGWTAALGRAAALAPVLVHGDIHEHQLLVDEGRITGILDWETARVDHPFWDFDLGEWDIDFWQRHEADFSRLWAEAWQAYAAVRGLDPDPAPLELAFRLRRQLTRRAAPPA